MIPIVVYAGDNIITGSTGIDYDNHPRFSFLGNEDTYFDEVKIMIYRQLGLLENQYFLSIKTQYNTGGTSRFKEGMLSIRQQYTNGYKFLLTVGTTVDQNGKKNPSRWAQCKDKCYR
jgi:hypothetical protein